MINVIKLLDKVINMLYGEKGTEEESFIFIPSFDAL